MAQINWLDKCWVATVYLVRSDRKVLLTWNKNLSTWIPVGGHIDVGEKPDDAVMREVKEETGFEFEFYPKSLESGSVKITKPFAVQMEKVPHHNMHINIVYFGRCTKWSDKGTTDEDEKLRWFSLSELEKEKPSFLPNVFSAAKYALLEVK
jgi:8-oxo-dGTP pyrophosphatase MutT (NUDIX family)